MKDNISKQQAIFYSHKMAQLSKALWKAIEKDWQDWIKPFQLNINEHHILWIAYHLEGATISEVSKYGVMHVSTAFNFSKKLEERGLLDFSKRENDKRSTYIELSNEGVTLLEDTLNAYNPESNSVLRGSLPLTEMYGKLPEFLDLSALIKEIYGDEYMSMLERSLENIEDQEAEWNQSSQIATSKQQTKSS
ncbi:HTH-type transcriptional regulator Hpr [Halobacillus shinanisalinarum]|uniref:HTH-type transcriptional regulator Hpr n=1 Tax=Halobacillus shinanisalinarum TaxID=2932258 RepID=A0ABY4GXX9_9BACI|nr:HTH-type transcriptional regulator Hpr [Halobacillus shinanisalinarum]UOQ92763.1 HTH-type transcriptional regulator Hpr [Halobacillus shinanisalinarum]